MKIAIAMNDYMTIKIDINARELVLNEILSDDLRDQFDELGTGSFVEFNMEDIKRLDSYINESKSEIIINGESDCFQVMESNTVIQFLMDNKIDFTIKGK